uniref:Uncharacterized protein n=1 Tax=Meloidogyne enterolobii TaxID=390850 RepID=A0A6V7VMX7_MELEN|nr:unnamed protein product [Meloidogyne enterolobii]
MFYSLPTEIKLDILKFFSYKKLCSIKQTNLYFCAFVNNFEGELAREKLYYIYINNVDRFEKEPHKLVNPKTIDFNFPLNEQLEEKWKNGLEIPIPLYMPNQDLDSNIVDCLSKVCVSKSHPIILQLPTIIKSKEDLKIVYYYLNKLFNCSFNYCYFENFIFNPELIQLLFGRVPKQIYVRECELFINDYNIENIFKFTLNNLISETLYIYFPLSKEIIEKSKDDLFKFLINGGDNFEVVQLIFNNSPGIVDDITINVQILYNRLIEVYLCKILYLWVISYQFLRVRGRTSNDKTSTGQNFDRQNFELQNFVQTKLRMTITSSKELGVILAQAIISLARVHLSNTLKVMFFLM